MARSARELSRSGSWPLAFRHWSTRLNNRRYVIARHAFADVPRRKGKGGKSANKKQRRRSKEGGKGQTVGTMEVDHLRTGSQ